MARDSESGGVRLQKVLSQAGIASRRVAERMIIDGRVEIDGQVVTELGTRVDTDASEIRVDGARVILDESLVYLALNKPHGMHSTMSDDRGRPCIGDSGRAPGQRQQEAVSRRAARRRHRRSDPADQRWRTGASADAPVLRNTQDVSGDGERTVPRGLGKKLRAGIELDDGPIAVDDFAVVDAIPGKTLIRVTLHEGRKRIVRRMLAAVGFPVQTLVRTDIGAVTLGEQRPGSIRALRRNEIGELYKAVGWSL